VKGDQVLMLVMVVGFGEIDAIQCNDEPSTLCEVQWSHTRACEQEEGWFDIQKTG
jgi:hypothetical protein